MCRTARTILDDVPVSLGLLIDNSGSMRQLRARVEAAALALVRASNPQDEVFVLNFADKPHIDVPFTSDVHILGQCNADASWPRPRRLDKSGRNARAVRLGSIRGSFR